MALNDSVIIGTSSVIDQDGEPYGYMGWCTCGYNTNRVGIQGQAAVQIDKHADNMHFQYQWAPEDHKAARVMLFNHEKAVIREVFVNSADPGVTFESFEDALYNCESKDEEGLIGRYFEYRSKLIPYEMGDDTP